MIYSMEDVNEREQLIKLKDNYLGRDAVDIIELKKQYKIFIKLTCIFINKRNRVLKKYYGLSIIISLLKNEYNDFSFDIIKKHLETLINDVKEENIFLNQLKKHIKLSIKLGNYKELYNIFDLLIALTTLSEIRCNKWNKLNSWVDCLRKNIYFDLNDNNSNVYLQEKRKVIGNFYKLS